MKRGIQKKSVKIKAGGIEPKVGACKGNNGRIKVVIKYHSQMEI